MAKKVAPLLSGDKLIGYLFYCHACGGSHQYRTALANENEQCPIWDFNGDEEAPTFTPSLMNRWPHVQDAERTVNVCHLGITNGKITYYGDCTHSLAGQTVEMVDWDKRYEAL